MTDRYEGSLDALAHEMVKEPDLWRCTVCGRVGTVGRCCGEETRERVNIAVLRELDELVEAARLLGGTQAKRGFGCHTDEDSRFERAMYESIDKHRAALLRLAEEHGNER